MENPVTALVKEFGSVRKLLAAIDESSPNLVQHWEKAGRIPHYRRPQILEAVREQGVKLPPAVVDRLFQAKNGAQPPKKRARAA